MSTKKARQNHSPIVREVIEDFIRELEQDQAIESDAVARVQTLLGQEGVPNSNAIDIAFFGRKSDTGS